MRITRIQLAGLALALAGATTAEDAAAGDVTVSTATTTPLQTSAPDGVSPGNVSVTAAGSIGVSAGQSAITVNSNNSVSNSGTIGSGDASNTVGIRIIGGNSGTINNDGAITLQEAYQPTDADPADGDLDGEWAQGVNRYGILLQAGPSFTGNINHVGGSIAIEGVNSAAIRLDAVLNGNLVSIGSIAVQGDDSRAIAINGGATGGVTGDVVISGSISVRGENSVGVLVDAPITGELSINGTHNVSGYHATTRPLSTANLDADDLLQSGSVIAVRYSVGEGVRIEGVGVEDDPDDDGDGVTETDEDTPDTNDDVTASISMFGSAPAIWIAPSATAPANLALGDTGNGFGLYNRGSVQASGVYDGVQGTAVRIEGVGGATVTTAGGFRNDGALSASAVEADAYAVYIGAGATVPQIMNRSVIGSQSIAEADRSAYGVMIAPGATVPLLDNSGIIGSQLLGEIGDAAAIVDRSNTLAMIRNTGAIQGQIRATDSDITDDLIPVVTGNEIAIDVSTSTIAVTIEQSATVPFTDDDAVDGDAATRPAVQIVGDVLMGSGADRINLLAGTLAGNVSFGAGADTLVINNGARYFGRITDSDNLLTIDVINGGLALDVGALTITSAHFGAGADLAVVVSPNAAESTLITATGQVVFDPGAVVRPILPLGLPASGTHVFLTAQGGLVGGDNVERTVTGTGAPFLYNVGIAVSQSVANSLEASYVIKTASELGLNANEEAAFDPILDALREDDDASFAFGNIIGEDQFFNAYADLLPNYSSAAAELAATAINQGQSAATNRLTTTRLRDVEETSVWAQEILYGLTREPESFGVEYRGQGFGIAAGIDAPLESGALFGVSAAFISSEVEEPGRVAGEITASFGQLNAYLGTSAGPIDLDFVAGAGAGRMSSRRFVAIGTDFQAISEAEWWSYEGHGSVRASMPMQSGWFAFTPQAALSYVALAEDGYEEDGGGPALDLAVDSTVSQRLWGDVGVELAGRFGERDSRWGPQLFLGYRANLIDESAERTLRFISGTESFTLTDETVGQGGPLIGLGFSGTNGFSTFSLDYEGEFGEQLTRHSLNASLRFRF